MFVKVDDDIIVNLLHVSEIIEKEDKMKLWMDDGEENVVVADKYKEGVMKGISNIKRAVQRLATGNFN
jgi:hypothetical protein